MKLTLTIYDQDGNTFDEYELTSNQAMEAFKMLGQSGAMPLEKAAYCYWFVGSLRYVNRERDATPPSLEF